MGWFRLAALWESGIGFPEFGWSRAWGCGIAAKFAASLRLLES